MNGGGISDEMLMAYADGELDDSARSAVDAYLAGGPDAVARLRVFQTTGRGLSDLFAQPMHEPVPQRLLDVIAVPEKIVPFDLAKRPARITSFTARPMALAASLAILAAGGSAFWFASQRGLLGTPGLGVEVASSGERVAAHVLAVALDTVASGAISDASIDGHGVTIKPVLAFATADKRFCRQYVIAMKTSAAYSGVACKLPDGVWRIEAHEAFVAPRSVSGQIAPASGNAAPKSVEETVDRLIAGDVLGRDAERAAMARGWRKAD